MPLGTLAVWLHRVAGKATAADPAVGIVADGYAAGCIGQLSVHVDAWAPVGFCLQHHPVFGNPLGRRPRPLAVGRRVVGILYRSLHGETDESLCGIGTDG